MGLTVHRATPLEICIGPNWFFLEIIVWWVLQAGTTSDFRMLLFTPVFRFICSRPIGKEMIVSSGSVIFYTDFLQMNQVE